ncbi:MAG: hypothetical protein ACT4NY_20395 [Pseudonocardiales bacterium]
MTLTLLRDTYQPGDDVSDLLDPTRYRTTNAVERHIIARVLPAAYTLTQAHQTLTFLAHQMNQDQTRDLAWWHIRRGLHLHTDATRVRNWLAGQHPQPPVPELLSELFSEELGYPITPADIGLEGTDQHEVGLRYSESIAATVVAVSELGRYDVRRRGFLHRGAFLVVASVAPSRDWLLAVLDTTEPRPHSRIGLVQVRLIREAFADFHEADVMHGGGYARRALTEYVTERVLPLLHDTDPNSEAGTALFTAASEHTYLLGHMAFDDGHHALAQRYFIQALRLAQECDDAALGAQILACMGEQALLLGYPDEALQLATAGRHGLVRAFSPACAADLWALQARAHAALGDTKAAVHAVVESERAFEHVVENEPEWARFIDDANLSCHWADTFVTLARPVEATRFARRVISAAAGQNRARRGALSQATLAQAALTRRDLDTALRAAYQTIDLATTVQSARCLATVRDLQTRIRPYRKLAPAREFDDYAREALTRANLN